MSGFLTVCAPQIQCHTGHTGPGFESLDSVHKIIWQRQVLPLQVNCLPSTVFSILHVSCVLQLYGRLCLSEYNSARRSEHSVRVWPTHSAALQVATLWWLLCRLCRHV